LFVVALVIVPIVWRLGRTLPESRRFTRMSESDATPAPVTSSMRRRFAMLAIVSFSTALFAAPSSNFQNEYLRDERGFSGARISLFSSVTSTPIGIGVAIFGPLADRRGRRAIGAIGILGGVTFAVLRYGFGGPVMWIAGTLSTIIGAATIPALGVYGPELFPTSLRGRANAVITTVTVMGSATGLVLAGQFDEHYDGLGPGIAWLGIGPAIVVLLVVFLYPETAHRELEDINPEDAPIVGFLD
jgi:MFS family permease